MKIKNNLKIKDSGCKIYILDSNYIGDILYEFNNVGYDIINFIIKNSGCEIDEVVNYLKNKYRDVEYEELLADTLEFINELKEENIIEDGGNESSSN